LRKKWANIVFYQVNGFPKWYYSLKSLENLTELTLFSREWLKKVNKAKMARK